MPFSTLTETRNAIASWTQDYTHHRLHPALGNMTPVAFAKKSLLEQQAA